MIVTLRHESEFRKAVIGRFRLALAADPYAWPPIADAGRSRAQQGSERGSAACPKMAMKALRRPAEDRDEE